MRMPLGRAAVEAPRAPDSAEIPLEDLSDSPPDDYVPRNVPPPAVVKLCRCHCEKAMLGFRVSYRFYSGETPLMSATLSGSKVKIVRTDAPDALYALMKVRHRKALFQFATVETGPSFSCEVKTVHQPIRYHRYFVMQLQIGNKAIPLHSKMPKKATGGHYMINFGGKFTQRSIKNSILLDGNEQNAIIVRRISENDLEVESIAEFPDAVGFAYAIVAWVCPY